MSGHIFHRALNIRKPGGRVISFRDELNYRINDAAPGNEI